MLTTHAPVTPAVVRVLEAARACRHHIPPSAGGAWGELADAVDALDQPPVMPTLEAAEFQVGTYEDEVKV